MKNNSIQNLTSYIFLLLIGTVYFYFDGGITPSLQYAAVFIISVVIIELIKRLFSKKKNESGAYPLPETDERIEKLSLKLMAQIFAVFLLIGAVILGGLYITNKASMIRVEYVLEYVVIVLVFTLTFGPKFVKKFDQ